MNSRKKWNSKECLFEFVAGLIVIVVIDRMITTITTGNILSFGPANRSLYYCSFGTLIGSLLGGPVSWLIRKIGSGVKLFRASVFIALFFVVVGLLWK